MSGHYHYHHHRRPSNQRAISELPPASPYPGVNPYADFPTEGDFASGFSPYSNSAEPPITSFEGSPEYGGNYPVPVSAVAPAPSSSSSGGLASLLGGLNLSNLDVKGIIEKMGGIDGLVANVGKVQKVMQGFQQLAPMMSVLTGVFGKKGKGSSPKSLDSYSSGYRPKKRRSSSAKRRSGSRRPSKRGQKRKRY